MTEYKVAKNNSGFSLVEVLVAMTILAIVTLPILASFTSAAKINSKASRQTNANAMGQQIVERFKALTLYQLTDGNTSTSAENYIVNNQGTGVYSYNVEKIDTPSDEDGASSISHNRYQFVMADFIDGNAYTDENGDVYCLATSGERIYVEVELNPSTYIESSTENSNIKSGFNSYNMPRFADVNREGNYVLLENILAEESSVINTLEEAVRNNFASSHSEYVTSDIQNVEIEKKDIKRKLVVKVDKDNISYDIIYSTDRASVTVKDPGSNAPPAIPVTPTSKTYHDGAAEITISKSDSIKTDENVYVFYNVFDRYSNHIGTTAEDEVEFIISSGIDKNIYLVEQEVKNYDFGISGEIVCLQRDNVLVNGHSFYEYTGSNFYTNVGGSGKEMGITQSKATRTTDYIYKMTVKIWIGQKGTDSDIFLKLEATKENGV